MPKKMQIARLNSRDRGIRNPGQQTGLVSPKRRLHPWLMQPVFPGETIIGGRYSVQNMFARMVQPHNAPASWSEIGLWYVPMSAFPNWMLPSVVGSAEDIGIQYSGEAVAGQGFDTPGLQSRNRLWAGEIGSGDGGLSDASRAAAYMPWTSHALYKIAAMWYENEFNDEASNITWTDDDLSQTPPLVGDLIRGALPAGVTPEINVDKIVDPSLTPSEFNKSVSHWAERLTVLGRPDFTYAEYLASHGINPRSVGGVPQPLSYRMVKNRPVMSGMCLPQGNAEVDPFPAVNSYATAENETSSMHRMPTVMGASSAESVFVDAAGVAPYGANYGLRVPGGVFIDEPGFIVGTHVWYQTELTIGNYAEHFTANRMIQWPTGGVGGYDELDFLRAQFIEVINDEGDQPEDPDVNTIEDGGQKARAFNLLNLLLNGDTFSNEVQTQAFNWRGAFGNPYPNDVQEMHTQIDGEIGILSHLVNAN